jgi:hypothetical protein
MYDAYNSVVSWMIAGGARIDEPDTRYLEHEQALREARRSAGRSLAPFAWISERLRARTPTRAACDPMTCSAAA